MARLKPQINKSEYLSKDIFESDFLRVFRPFLFLQRIMGVSRVDARDQFVTPLSYYQKMYSALCFFLTVVLSYYSAHLILNEFSSHTKVYYLSWGAIVINTCAYFLNLVHVRLFNAEANVKMYITMQQLDRAMGVEHNTELNNMLYVMNLKTVLGMVALFGTFILSSFAGGVPLGLGFVGISWTSTPFLFEVCFCVNLVYYFLIRLRFINAILANHIKPYRGDPGQRAPGFKLPWNKDMRRNAAKTHSYETNDVHVYLKKLIIGYNEFAGLYRFQVLLFFINYILFILLDVEFGIAGLKTNVINFRQWLVSVTFLTIGFFVSIFLCIRCELFLKEIMTTKSLAVNIMSRHFDGPIRQKTKTIIKMIEQTPPRFSVYDMWDMDANKLLKMFNIVTTMLVTQLQLAFL